MAGVPSKVQDGRFEAQAGPHRTTGFTQRTIPGMAEAPGKLVATQKAGSQHKFLGWDIMYTSNELPKPILGEPMPYILLLPDVSSSFNPRLTWGKRV